MEFNVKKHRSLIPLPCNWVMSKSKLKQKSSDSGQQASSDQSHKAPSTANDNLFNKPSKFVKRSTPLINLSNPVEQLPFFSAGDYGCFIIT